MRTTRSIAMVLLFALACSAGAAERSFADLKTDYIAAAKEIRDLLKGVKDEASAKEALPKFDSLSSTLAALQRDLEAAKASVQERTAANKELYDIGVQAGQQIRRIREGGFSGPLEPSLKKMLGEQGPSPASTYGARVAAKFNEMRDLLAPVKDEASAKDAATKFAPLLQQMAELKKEGEKLQLNKDDFDKMKKDVATAAQPLMAEIRRIKGAGFAAPLEDSFKAFNELQK